MLIAHIDESQKDDVFVMAGYISTAERWAAFADAWQKILDCRSPQFKILWNGYKMSEMNMNSPTDMEQSGWLYSVIEDHALAAFSVVFPVSGLRGALRRLPFKERLTGIEKLDNPYYFGFRAYIDLLIQDQRGFGFDSPIQLVFDEKTERLKCLEGWEYMKSGATGDRALLLGDMPTFKKGF